MATITRIIAFPFKDRGAIATGLSPTLDAWRLDTGAQVLAAVAMTEIGTTGIYTYSWGAFDTTLPYMFRADGGATLKNADRYLEAANEAEAAEEITDQTDVQLSAGHGAGSWATATGFATPGDAMDLVTDAVDAAAVATSGAQEIRDEILTDATPFAGANIDAAVSSRAAPGDAMDLVTDAVDAAAVATTGAQEIRDEILTDATPFAGANIDAAITSRPTAAQVDTQLSGTHGAGSWATATGFAVPGDAMDLVTDAVDADALAASGLAEIDSQLTGTHGAGSWVGVSGEARNFLEAELSVDTAFETELSLSQAAFEVELVDD